MKSSEHWKRIGLHSHHGICIPLSALRTANSCGIGEFLDLLPLIDWCAHLGFDCLQLLPLNDTGRDPSFFNPVSSCALHPIYLSLKALPDPKDDLEPFVNLNRLPRIAYLEVLELKLRWLFRYFEKHYPATKRDPNYAAFLQNHSWLLDYARFKALKTMFHETHWKYWPAPYSEIQADAQLIDFHSFLQYHCFLQMDIVRKQAIAKNIFLKGDMPILLNPDSADVWAEPHLFQQDLVAGAPPDPFNPAGQKWGFPLYNWEAIRQERFAWWARRLRTLQFLYHIYRIDHVVGFFRIWAIPEDSAASEGFFIPSDPALWETQGREILEKFLELCPLLPIAEDLGTIPQEVYATLKELRICGTKLLRWQYKKTDDKEFIPYRDYEPFSMTTVSDADLDPLDLWWQQFPEEAIAFARFKHWHYEPNLSAERHLEILQDSHHTASYFHINPLQEYLFPFPELIWPNPEDERINIPGTLLPTNWTYRLRPYLEDLIAYRPLRDAILVVLNKNS